MKILYIAQDCSPTYGSECRVGFGIISTMAKLGHDITVITNNGCIPPFEDYIKKNNIANIKFLGIERKRIFLTKFGYHGAMHKEFKNKALKIAVELNKKEHFDIIHHLTPIIFSSLNKYWRIKGPKIIVGPIGAVGRTPISFDSYIDFKSRILENIRIILLKINTKIIKKYYLPKYDFIYFVNNETYHNLITQKIIDKFGIIPEIGVFENEIPTSLCEKRQDNPIVFVVVGRLVYRKGHLFLIDALENVNSSKKYEVHIIGDGPYRTRIQKRLQNSRIKEKVKLLGNVDFKEMDGIYKTASALIFPTFREATGSVILESLKFGIPVITINKYGAPLLLDKSDSFLYDGSTKEELIKNLTKCIEKCLSSDLDKKKQNALLNCHKFTFEKRVDVFLTQYNELLNKSGT